MSKKNGTSAHERDHRAHSMDQDREAPPPPILPTGDVTSAEETKQRLRPECSTAPSAGRATATNAEAGRGWTQL